MENWELAFVNYDGANEKLPTNSSTAIDEGLFPFGRDVRDPRDLSDLPVNDPNGYPIDENLLFDIDFGDLRDLPDPIDENLFGIDIGDLRDLPNLPAREPNPPPLPEGPLIGDNSKFPFDMDFGDSGGLPDLDASGLNPHPDPNSLLPTDENSAFSFDMDYDPFGPNAINEFDPFQVDPAFPSGQDAGVFSPEGITQQSNSAALTDPNADAATGGPILPPGASALYTAPAVPTEMSDDYDPLFDGDEDGQNYEADPKSTIETETLWIR